MAPTQRFNKDDDRRRDAVKFTVVIPTWNEEGWLPGLLGRVRTIDRIGHVIVADNCSSDRTRDIATADGAHVVLGGSPARGRNSGAKASSAEFIVFADADVVFTSEAVERAARHFEENSEVVAVHFPLKPIGASWFVRSCYKALDKYFWILSQIGVAQGVGTFLAVRASAFADSHGFDEGLAVGEDADLIRRLGRLGWVVYDRTVVIGTSPRRFITENQFLFALKTILWAGLRLSGLKVSWPRYCWKSYPISLSEQDSPRFDDFFKSYELSASILRCMDGATNDR